MRTTGVVFIAAVAAFAGYLAAPTERSPGPVTISQGQDRNQHVPLSAPVPEPTPRAAAATDPAGRLARTLEMPAGAARERETRLAMNAWLASEGGAALAAARRDARLANLVERMLRLAMQVYPEVLLEDPTVLEGYPQKDALLAQAIYLVAQYDPQRASAMIEEHFGDNPTGLAMRASLEHIAMQFDQDPIENPRRALQEALDEPDPNTRRSRLATVLAQVSADDPEFAAELLAELPPGPEHQTLVWTLVNSWAEKDPERAARWVVDADSMAAQFGLQQVAQIWGRQDLDAAAAFADELSGSNRSRYLNGLAQATFRLTTEEQLAWISRYEGDPAYPQLASIAAQRLAQQDVDAALELVASLPEASRMLSYQSILPSVAMRDPDKALTIFETIDDGAREQLTPIVSALMARSDPRRALDWARDLDRGPARDRAIAGVAMVLAQTDTDSARRAIDDIENQALRQGPVMMLLQAASSDETAISLGHEYDVDREQVLQIRSQGFSRASQGFSRAMVLGNHPGGAMLINPDVVPAVNWTATEKR